MATYFDDQFDGTLDTLLSAHTADVGGGYSKLGSTTMTNALTGDSFAYRNTGGGSSAIYRRTATMEVADYLVELTFKVKSILAADIIVAYGRLVDFSNYYEVDCDRAGTIKLRKSTTAGGLQTLASASVTLVAGDTHTIGLLMVSSTITLTFDGVAVTALTGTNPITDSSFASAGFCGVQVGYGGSSTETSSTGLQAARIRALDAADTAPGNTVAPAISTDGTPGITETITVSNGTWTNTPTSFAYVWKRAGTPISGATTNSYTIQVADGAQPIRCTVTATNANGSTSADSDTITPSAAQPPSNTVAPVVSGSRIPAASLSVTNGTWTNTPITYTYQWKRDGASISGATSNSYTVDPSDIGHTVTCQVTATNADGSGVSTSNGLVIVADMVDADTQLWLASGAGLGGSPSVALPAPTAVYDAVTHSEAVAGDVEYRLVYLKNTHPVRSFVGTVIWIEAQTTSTSTDVAIAVAAQAAGVDATAIANESTPPATVTFSAPTDAGSGLSVGTLGPGQARGIWIRWTVTAGAADTPEDAMTLGWDGTPT